MAGIFNPNHRRAPAFRRWRLPKSATVEIEVIAANNATAGKSTDTWQ
jgi:hypothetical protein